jgi:glycosyltransferase involved in cell wall biosynthesis
MLVWLASYPRSGNHLLRAVLKRSFDFDSYEIYQQIAKPQRGVAAIVGGRAFADESPDAFVARARASDELFLVKTHEPVPDGDRCIYLVRDARAALVSFQKYLADSEHRRCTLPALIEGREWPGNWQDHVERFLARDPANTLLLTYEELSSANPPLERIGAFLGALPLRPFNLSFAELHAINPKVFPGGSNEPGVRSVERDHADLFWRHCGRAMRRLGYGGGQPTSASKPGKVFFLHLPKCAGTSLWSVFGGLVGRKRMFQAYRPERLRELTEMEPARRNSLRIVGGHFDLAAYRRLFDLSQYYCVTTFREPFERVVSEYHYVRGNPNHSDHDRISKQSLRDFIMHTPNPITYALCGSPDAAAAAAVVNEVFDRWVFMEDLSSLVASVCGHLGKRVRALPHMNIGPRSINAVTLDDEHRELIAKSHSADVELYRILRGERAHYQRAPIANRPAPGTPETGRVAARARSMRSEVPTFQIVTPTYNVERYLSETIESVVTQEGDFEIRYHIQDGGSRDRTLAIVREWQSRIDRGEFTPRCAALRLTINYCPDQGMYDALGHSFRRLAPSPEDFCTWINGDDKLAPGALATVAAAFRDMPSVELVGGRTALINAEGEPLVSSDLPGYPRRSIAAGLHDGRRLPFVMQEGTFWRMSLWQRTGGIDPRFRFAGDWDLWRRFAAEADYVTLDAVTGYHRRRPGQLTESLRKYYREIDERVREGTEERAALMREYRRAVSSTAAALEAFPAFVGRRNKEGRWSLCDSRAPPEQERELLSVDGDWVVLSGFDRPEGPFPERRIKRSFRWAVSRPARFQIFSARAGRRTLWITIGSAAIGQSVRVRMNGHLVAHRHIFWRHPRLVRLAFEYDFDAGPAVVEIGFKRSVFQAGRTVGVALASVGFWRGGSQLAWYKRLVPKPLRAFL